MKIAFIHNEKKIGTGAHYINDLISSKLKEHGVIVRHFYPSTDLFETPVNLKGISNILFFFSLLEHRDEILKCDLIQGTTYTPLTFLAYDIPVIAHFGSTTKGFLDVIPNLKSKDSDNQFWLQLKKEKVLKEVQIQTRRPLKDIADIEKFVAVRCDAVIATSKKVRSDLISLGVEANKISVIYNAIEDYWFNKSDLKIDSKPHLIFLGRLGGDVFNLKLKGLDRLYNWYKNYPDFKKLTIGITTNEKLSSFMDRTIPNHQMMSNVEKTLLPDILKEFAGSPFLIPSRYEGFSLSLIEGMSQGLIPIVYEVGVAPEIIKNGVNGFIVKNENEIKRHTDEILGNLRLRKKMAAAAQNTALEFRADVMAQKFIEEYKTVLANAKPRASKQKSFLTRWFR
jgi:glycosyltransferase involved in cell wall biosynthesis